MRVGFLYMVLLTSSMQLLLAHSGNGQALNEIQLTIGLENENLTTVLKRLQRETGVLFSFPTDAVRKIKVNLPEAKRSVEDFLDATLENTGLAWRQAGVKSVIIYVENEKGEKEKGEDRRGIAKNKAEQASLFTVTGTVTDAGTQQPMPGVNVVVKGSLKGTSTDKDGYYTINAEDNDVLVFSFIGYKAFETQVSSRAIIDVALEVDITALDEVVINAGYWTVTKEEQTGSISKVKAEVIERQPVSNPLLTLQGRVPGLYIEQIGGMPGRNIRVSIRGKNSIQNGTDPLYIVDGVPFSSQTLSYGASDGLYGGDGISPLNSINPNDIESIEVLKDADATAIYGSRGANGVILITTKRGKQGKTTLDVNFSSGFSKVGRELDLLNTQQFLKMRKDAVANDGYAAYLDDPSFDIYWPDLKIWDTTRYTNWQKELLGGTANFTNAQATISGGSGNTQYSFGGTYQKQNTVFPGNSDTKRGALHLSVVNESPNEKFKARFSASYVLGNSDMLGFDLTEIAMRLEPNAPELYDENGELNWENSTWNNPLLYLKQNFQSNDYNLICNGVLAYNILPGLNVQTGFGINDIRSEQKTLSPSTMYNPANGATPASSTVYASTGTNKLWIVEPQISWENSRGREGKIDVIIGGSFQNQESQQLLMKYQGFTTNALINDPNSALVADVQSSNKSIYKYAAIYGRVNYNYKGKYIINVTGRRDGSSRFGPGKQFANLGAIGAAWIFSKESFTVGALPFLSFGKLRSSYGVTGNDQIGNYEYLDTYASGGTVYQGSQGLVPQRLYNPNYAWETTKKFEVAMELGLLDNRILFTTAYYNNRSSNQLVNYPVASTTGFTSVRKNLPAKIRNTGVELELSTVNTDGPIIWSTSINLTIPRNKLLEFPNLESSSYANTYVVGKSLTVSKRYRYQSVDPATGVYTFEDMNNDGSITAADRLHVSEIQQDYYGGLNNSLTYKGWSVDVFLQFVKKNGFGYYSTFFSPGYLNQPIYALNNPWENPDDNATVQRYTIGGSAADLGYSRLIGSDANVVDASFIRLKNVSLSYTFPTVWTKGITSRLFIQGQNLFTITNYKGLDPENNSSSILPTLQTIVLGAQISF